MIEHEAYIERHIAEAMKGLGAISIVDLAEWNKIHIPLDLDPTNNYMPYGIIPPLPIEEAFCFISVVCPPLLALPVHTQEEAQQYMAYWEARMRMRAELWDHYASISRLEAQIDSLFFDENAALFSTASELMFRTIELNEGN